MTCTDCGQPTISPGTCVDCSRKRFDDYPRLKAENDELRQSLKTLVEQTENMIRVMNKEKLT